MLLMTFDWAIVAATTSLVSVGVAGSSGKRHVVISFSGFWGCVCSLATTKPASAAAYSQFSTAVRVRPIPN
jgi:hypothetical protein